MPREPIVYAAAGMVFGFVLGYLVANAEGPGVGRAVPAAAASPPSLTPPPTADAGPHGTPSGAPLALRPEPDVIVDLGACLVNGGKATEGLEQFERALKLAPGHKKAGFNKGVALMELGRPQDAVAVWDDLLKRFPADPQLQPLKRQIEQARAGAPRPS